MWRQNFVGLSGPFVKNAAAKQFLWFAYNIDGNSIQRESSAKKPDNSSDGQILSKIPSPSGTCIRKATIFASKQGFPFAQSKKSGESNFLDRNRIN
jgi:hypothetical protein